MYHLQDRPRVLVLDDEENVCAALNMVLKADGYDVVVCQTGEEAEAHIQTQWFDLAIIDLRLKYSRGDVVFYHAIAHQPHLERQTVFITGDITDGGWRLIGATGCPMMLKPWNNDELLNLLYSMYPRNSRATA
jgi:DNA-binding NtrC family response regulator